MHTCHLCLGFYAGRNLRFSILAVYCLSLLLSSCAQTPRTSTTNKLPQFERLAVFTPEMLTDIERADSHTDRHYEGSPHGEVPLGTSVGIAGGAAGGTAYGAWICAPSSIVGPIFFGCVAMYTLGGALVGGAAGAAGDHYAATGLSETDILYLEAIISKIDQERDYQQELAAHLKQKLPPEMQSTPELADIQVLAIISRINFIQRSGDQMQIETTGLLVIREEVEVETDQDEFFHTAVQKVRQTKTHKIEFSTMSPEEDIDLWLADGGNHYGVAISECLTDLANQMTVTLLRAWEPSARGETE
jgi:hypothetical protein